MIRSQKHQKSKNIESIYALSPIQEGLLFHTLYAPNSGVYIEQILLTFSGQMNAEIFKQSWPYFFGRVVNSLCRWSKNRWICLGATLIGKISPQWSNNKNWKHS